MEDASAATTPNTNATTPTRSQQHNNSTTGGSAAPGALFSLRIVTVDHYMRSPVADLDPFYSEFRGTIVAKVPVIRIFGTDANGTKTCAHVHGVFPYLYVPYDGGAQENNADDDANRFAYQLASSLDKALNISLGQSNAEAEHIFKVVHVKGIPFYGYHPKAHQFLKIYLYNPNLVRRVGNLLQNGAILGRVFQPHESHVPFILQFMIDYNLYGMSCLHYPVQEMRFRLAKNEPQPPGVSRRQIAKKLDRTATSKQECDLVAANILNRLEVAQQQQRLASTAHANPGIATIWKDERIRRDRLANAPVLEIPAAEERPLARPSDSNAFHLEALRTKLEHLRASASSGSGPDSTLLDCTLNGTAEPNQSRFSLRRLLTNAVYPAECSQLLSDSILNASCVMDHHHSSATSSNRSRMATRRAPPAGDVDENLVLSLSQSALDVTLNAEEFDLLDVMQQLEDHPSGNDNDQRSPIDTDSILAQLSQPPATRNTEHANIPSQRTAEAIAAAWHDTDFDPDDDLLNDFSMCMAELTPDDANDHAAHADNRSLDEIQIPQLDGAADTPMKTLRSKYAPLAVTVAGTRTAPQIPTPIRVTHRRQILGPVAANATVAAGLAADPTKRVRIETKDRYHLGDPIDLTLSDEEGPPAEVDAAAPDISFIDCRLRSSKRKSLLDEPPLKTLRIAGDAATTNDTNRPLRSPLLPLPRRNAPTESHPKSVVLTNMVSDSVANHIIDHPPTVRLRKYADIEFEFSHPSEHRTDTPVLHEAEGAIDEIDPLDDDADADETAIAALADAITEAPAPRRILRSRKPKTPPVVKAPAAAVERKPRAKRNKNARSNAPPTLDERFALINCDVARRYDERNNFFPEPGPSRSIITLDQDGDAQPMHGPQASDVNVDHLYDDATTAAALRNDAAIAAALDGSPPKRANKGGKQASTRKPSATGRRGRRKATLTTSNAAIAAADLDTDNEGDVIILPLLRAPTFDEVLNVMPDFGIAYAETAGNAADDAELEEFSSDVLDCGEGFASVKSGLARRMDGGGSACSSTAVPISKRRKHVDAADTIVVEEPDETAATDVDYMPPKRRRTVSHTSSNNAGSTRTSNVHILVPLLRPPNFVEVLHAMPAYGIPYCVATEPFYSDAADAHAAKEVGQTMLCIPTRTLHDLPAFESDVLDDAAGMVRTMDALVQQMFADNGDDDNDVQISARQARSLLADEQQPAVMFAAYAAPSRADAEQWIGGDPVQNGGDADPLKLTPPSSPEVIEATPPDEPCPKPYGMLRTRLSRNSIATPAKSPLFRNAVDRMNRPTAICSPHKSDVICLDEDTHEDRSLAEHLAADRAVNGSQSQLFDALHERRPMNGIAKPVHEKSAEKSRRGDHSFGISGATLENTFDFKMDLDNLQAAHAHADFNYLTVMSLEVHVMCRGHLKPDPEHDAIVCLFYNIQNNVPATHGAADCLGIIMQQHDDDAAAANELDARRTRACLTRLARAAHPRMQIEVACVGNELELLQHLLALVAHWDPDIFAGYEIEMASWGYVLQRAQQLGVNLKASLSRVLDVKHGSSKQQATETAAADEPNHHAADAAASAAADGFYGVDYIEFEVRLSGRIFLDIWRVLRPEIALTSYTFESSMYHILHRRCPRYSWRELTRLWRRPAAGRATAAAAAAAAAAGATAAQRCTVLEYYVERVLGNLELLNQLDLIGRTCELAKLFGIQFYEVLSRGSQFRVESMMLRMAKPKNIIPVSPSVQQRAHMRAPEYLPLILEPLSRLYTEPLIVLDFQSLYPSIIIAYNYCFSTCLGRVEHLGHSAAGDPFEFGASLLRLSAKLVRQLVERDLVTVSPCGVVFVKAAVREGVLPRMLREILDTRLMVKQSMKLHAADRRLQRVLHSRQLGLKLMANVTYGYTAANFSGRMPCVEVGDSVVSKGRETLERAIAMVTANEQWRARVIYGDTDSMFVLVPGRSRSDAFRIGAEIAAAVTAANPHPVKLKLEKVYDPSILQTKKRYVGYMYESADQTEPVYEAKGIETVRRDGCPAVAKMLEKTLRQLFETRDVSAVKRYVCRQFAKICAGRANLQDFTFAKEFRGTAGYKPGACVPSLELARRWVQTDRRAEPRRGERVPYVIVNGPPGVPLIRLVRHPLEFMADAGLTINAVYYITKVIVPALNRCLLLIGADAGQWFADLPRPQLAQANTVRAMELAAAAAKPPTGLASFGSRNATKKSTIVQYFATTGCPTDCGAQTKHALCAECQLRPRWTAVVLAQKMAAAERRLALLRRTCASCSGVPVGAVAGLACESLDCPVLDVLNGCRRQNAQVAYWREIVQQYCA